MISFCIYLYLYDDMLLWEEFVISWILSSHNKNLKQQTDQHYSSWMDQCHSSMLRLSFIQKVKENTSSRREGMPTQKTWREERHPAQFWLLFFFFFFLFPLDQPYVNWASQVCYFFYLRSSLQSLDFLCSIFAGFSLPCLLATTIVDFFFLF